DQFKTLLNSIISGPKEKIKNLDIIPAKEREILLFEFNKTSDHLMSETNVIDWFIIQVGIDKNKAAIVYEGRVVTYDELNRLSNRIANYIIENAALGKNDIIAVVVNDPVLSAASVLAIMKTGAAYLPILADNPPDRISFIIKDSNARVVLTDSDINISKGNEIYLDINGGISENESLPSSEIAADSLAYVIYTSGSTGVPKGVMIEHVSLSNLISSLRQNVYSRYKHSLNELMITSFAFDVSVKQIFASLCNGNTLHILSSEKRLDSREIIKYIIGNSINVVDLTPSIFSVMLEEGFGEIRKPDLKELFLGSEALPYKLVKDFYNNSDNRGIIMTNFYGPTECCVESSSFRINPDDLNEDYTIVPIGRPILNECIYILDKFLNLCPINVAGEICIAGKGLARQYLNDPGKTAEKFVRVSSLNDKRIYKTGDLGRILPDGNIEFLGRMDEQVKIRGYRVELQEVEKCIRELKEINECIVTLFDRNGSSELAAYFSSDQTINVAKLKKDLDRFLPKYMIPSYFVQIEKIPLSNNGKANKKLLPDPVGIQKKKISRKPSDEIELMILQICSGVLKNENINLEDNFFEIGGNSLNAVRVISGIQKEMNADIPLREIFYNPVLLDIAGKVKEIIGQRDTLFNNIKDEKIIVPVSDEELKLLSALQFDDEE
ncbi:MAG: non-ribosomal peptide synthetase, partial [Candidatus Paceibacterota bacterium]